MNTIKNAISNTNNTTVTTNTTEKKEMENMTTLTTTTKATTTNWWKKANTFTLKPVNDDTPHNKKFEKLLKKTQKELKKYCNSRLESMGYKPVNKDGFLYAEGTVPVMLVAHMDTVHESRPKDMYYNDGKLYSAQGIGGDDRCGIYMIFEIIKELKCSVLFTEDEEIGCVGAEKFADDDISFEIKGINYIIEFDRKGSNDAVFYECANNDFIDWVTHEPDGSKGFFSLNYGTCSDICYIAPALGVAAVNLSCGYHNEHHLDEYIVLEEMYRIIDEAKKLIARPTEMFEWVEERYTSKRGSLLNYGYYDDYDYYDAYYDGYGNKKSGRSYMTYEQGYSDGYSEGYDDGYKKGYTTRNVEIKKEMLMREHHITYIKKGSAEQQTAVVEAFNLGEALGKVFMNVRDISFNDIINMKTVSKEDK